MVAHSRRAGTIIVGQRALFRGGVAALLKHTPYKVIASVQRSSELKNVRASGSRTLVILGVDDENGDENGNTSEAAENIKALRSLFPGSTIVVIAETRRPTNFQQIMMAAPDGYVSNLTSRDVLLKLLDVALLDQQVMVLPRPMFSPTPVDEDNSTKSTNLRNAATDYNWQRLSTPIVGDRDPPLSQREREILIRLAESDSNKQIARLCNITESTVKVHLKAILRKITVHNRTQAAIWAIAKGYHVIPNSDRGPKTIYSVGGGPAMQGQRTSSNGKPPGPEVSAK